MYARRIQDRELTFDFAEGLIKDNLLIVDRETSSVWSQLDGKAVDGPMRGTPLPVVASIQATWKFWRTRHPGTRVMAVPGKEGYPYRYRNRRPGAPRPRTRPKGHDTSALGYAISRGGESMFFPFSELARAKTPFRIDVGGETITVHYDGPALTAWATDARGGLLPGVLAYRFGWMDFNPDSKVFAAGRRGE